MQDLGFFACPTLTQHKAHFAIIVIIVIIVMPPSPPNHEGRDSQQVGRRQRRQQCRRPQRETTGGLTCRAGRCRLRTVQSAELPASVRALPQRRASRQRIVDVFAGTISAAMVRRAIMLVRRTAYDGVSPRDGRRMVGAAARLRQRRVWTTKGGGAISGL